MVQASASCSQRDNSRLGGAVSGTAGRPADRQSRTCRLCVWRAGSDRPRAGTAVGSARAGYPAHAVADFHGPGVGDERLFQRLVHILVHVLADWIRRYGSCRPKSGRAGVACRVCLSAGAAVRRRNRTNAVRRRAPFICLFGLTRPRRPRSASTEGSLRRFLASSDRYSAAQKADAEKKSMRVKMAD